MSCGNLCNSESLPWRQKDALKWRLLWSSCLLKKYIYISWKNKGSHSSKHLEWYVSKHIWWYTLPIYNRMIQTHNTIYIYNQESTPQLFLKGFFCLSSSNCTYTYFKAVVRPATHFSVKKKWLQGQHTHRSPRTQALHLTVCRGHTLQASRANLLVFRNSASSAADDLPQVWLANEELQLQVSWKTCRPWRAGVCPRSAKNLVCLTEIQKMDAFLVYELSLSSGRCWHRKVFFGNDLSHEITSEHIC